MLRVPVSGGVDQAPDFDRALLRRFGRGIVPAEVVQLADNRITAIRVQFGEDEVAIPYRLVGIQERERDQIRGHFAVVVPTEWLVHLELQDHGGNHIASAIEWGGG